MWELAINVNQTPQPVVDFYKQHPGAPQQIPCIIFNNLEFRAYDNLTTLSIHTEPPQQQWVSPLFSKMGHAYLCGQQIQKWYIAQ
jgi:hypothetical protein